MAEAAGLALGVVSAVAQVIKTIKLIRLLCPEHDPDSLMCSLDTFLVGDLPPYRAVSHAWGSETAEETIAVNSQRIKLSRKVFAILLYLSREKVQTHLWIDSLCIDSSDAKERAWQVQLLPEIFASAEAVLIVPGTPKIWGKGHYAVKDFKSNTNTPFEADRAIFRKTTHNFHNPVVGTSSGGLIALKAFELVLSPYFKRVWTLQELVFAKDIYVLHDSKQIHWEDFLDCASSANEELNHASPRTIFSLLEVIRLGLIVESSKIWRSSPEFDGRNLYLADILSYQSCLNPADPRDHIWALGAIAAEFCIWLQPPDYSKGVRQVYQEANAALLDAHTEISPFLKRSLNMFGSTNFAVLSATPNWWKSRENLSSRHRKLMNAYKKVLNASHTAHLVYDDVFIDRKLVVARNVDRPGAQFVSRFPYKSDYGYVFTQDMQDESFKLFRVLLEALKHELYSHIVFRSKEHVAISVQTVCTNSNTQSASGTRNTYTAGQQGEEPCKATDCTSLKTPLRSRKRAAGRDGHDDEEGDDNQHVRRPLKQLKDDISIWERLACPYFQRNSQGPRILGACRGLGFENLTRLKEHLYRDHLIYPCLRCGAVFRKPAILETHAQQAEGCAARNWRVDFDRALGFDNSQEKDIRARTTQSWQAVFKILFPEDLEHTYPPQNHYNPQFMQFFDRFQANYREQIQQLVPQYLANAPFLGTLSEVEQNNASAWITKVVEMIHRQIAGEFRNQIIRASQGPELPETNRLFLDYLNHVAPEGALDDNAVNEGENVDLVNLFPGFTNPHVDAAFHHDAEDVWQMI